MAKSYSAPEVSHSSQLTSSTLKVSWVPFTWYLLATHSYLTFPQIENRKIGADGRDTFLVMEGKEGRKSEGGRGVEPNLPCVDCTD